MQYSQNFLTFANKKELYQNTYKKSTHSLKNIIFSGSTELFKANQHRMFLVLILNGRPMQSTLWRLYHTNKVLNFEATKGFSFCVVIGHCLV